MDDAQAIETLRELEDKGTVIFLREYADRLDLKGHPVHASELRKLLDALPALSVVEAQLATHDAAMAAANREVLRCMDERDGWKRAHDLAAADWRAAEARANHLQDGLRLIRDTAARWVDRGDTLTASWVIEKADAALARSETPT